MNTKLEKCLEKIPSRFALATVATKRWEQLMHGAARRFPFVSDAEILKLVCHPDAMTPDADLLLAAGGDAL